MYVLAIYVIIFACLTALLIKGFKPWGNGETQSLHWLWWTLYQPSLMTKGAACSLAPRLQCQPLGKSTIIGLPVRLQGLVGEWGGMQLDPYPSDLTDSPKKFGLSSACQIVRTWEEIIFYCNEKFLSRRGSWTENQPGLERPFSILLLPSSEMLDLGHREETAEVLHQQIFLLPPMDAESTYVCGFNSERLPFKQENERCCGFVSPSQPKDCRGFITIMILL